MAIGAVQLIMLGFTHHAFQGEMVEMLGSRRVARRRSRRVARRR
jgi:hypothetical protein